MSAVEPEGQTERALLYGEPASFKERKTMQINSSIPNLPTVLTYECRLAVSGKGPRGYEWSDKPHRLIFDLCSRIEALAAVAAEPSGEGR